MKLPFTPSSTLPSQQPKTKDDFERGFDKGATTVIKLVLDQIDSKVSIEALRHNITRMRDAYQ